jgi:hypothetical protein
LPRLLNENIDSKGIFYLFIEKNNLKKTYLKVGTLKYEQMILDSLLLSVIITSNVCMKNL